MSDFCVPSKTRMAIKNHICTYCAEAILRGSPYVFQTGHYDGRWFKSKMHPECFADLCESGDGEYMPYSNERPSQKGGK